MLSFSVIIFYSEIEIGPHLPYRKNVISAFKLSKKLLGPGTCFREKKNDDLSLASHQKKPLPCLCCVGARARERALMTRKSCAVGTRNVILGNPLNWPKEG